MNQPSLTEKLSALAPFYKGLTSSLISVAKVAPLKGATSMISRDRLADAFARIRSEGRLISPISTQEAGEGKAFARNRLRDILKSLTMPTKTRAIGFRAPLRKRSSAGPGAAVGALLGAGGALYHARGKKPRETIKETLIGASGGALAGAGAGKGLAGLRKAYRGDIAQVLRGGKALASGTIQRASRATGQALERARAGIHQELREAHRRAQKGIHAEVGEAILRAKKEAPGIGEGLARGAKKELLPKWLQKKSEAGLGARISSTMARRGGANQAMMLGMRDPQTEQFTQSLLELVNQGRTAQAKVLVRTAGFPESTQRHLFGAIDHLRTSQMPAGWRAQTLMSAMS